jgi:hypothetical protein
MKSCVITVARDEAACGIDFAPHLREQHNA